MVAGALGAALAAGTLTLEADRASAQPAPGPSHGRSADQGGGKGQGVGGGSGKTVAAANPVLAATAGGTGTTPTTQGLQRDLAQLVQDNSLGTLGLAVADGTTGQLLYGSGESTPATPASITKLLTSLAAFELIPADTRLTTKVVAGATPGEITLVGGGDPTVTGLPVDQVRIGWVPVDADTAPASLTDLAKQTAAALKAAGTTSVKLSYDTSLYSGSPLHPQHDGANIAPVSPLMVDEGRIDPKSTEDAPARVSDPAQQAADAFAALLQADGISVDGGARQGGAAAGARVLGAVESPTLARLVERMLATSDNSLAEAVARQVARAAHQPLSFDGGVKAVTDTLAKLGIPMAGVVLHDGSGLDNENLMSPMVLTKVLLLAASAEHPELRPLLTSMPIAGFTGTLAGRFGPATGAQSAVGIVHAKTGTLGESGVYTMAGTAVDADGRLLAFTVMTRTTATPDAARAAVDRVVAGIAGCGCK